MFRSLYASILLPVIAFTQTLYFAPIYNQTSQYEVNLKIYFYGQSSGVFIYSSFAGYIKSKNSSHTDMSFMYHIHDKPVTNNNCSSTGGHFAGPFFNTSGASGLLSFEIGDLSGKWGKLNISTDNEIQQFAYLDSTPSLNPNNASFIGNRSIVIHSLDKTRIACANILPFSL